MFDEACFMELGFMKLGFMEHRFMKHSFMKHSLNNVSPEVTHDALFSTRCCSPLGQFSTCFSHGTGLHGDVGVLWAER
jgi:hypothetical protein